MKKEFYENVAAGVHDQNLEVVRVSSCPGHISNVNHPNHDPKDEFTWKA
jgi:hypothetical protein